MIQWHSPRTVLCNHVHMLKHGSSLKHFHFCRVSVAVGLYRGLSMGRGYRVTHDPAAGSAGASAVFTVESVVKSHYLVQSGRPL